VLDRYSHDVEYFRDAKGYFDYLHRHSYKRPDFITICTPNHLHATHTMQALAAGCNVICEKPVVVDSRDFERLHVAENQYKNKAYALLQLRHHPELVKLKRRVNDNHEVTVEYITPRGPWFQKSWKGNVNISGGITMNIGVHLFDALAWIFGSSNLKITVEVTKPQTIIGNVWLDTANVRFILSTDPSLSASPKRAITVDGKRIGLDGFTDLHNKTYEAILNGKGSRVIDCLPGIVLAERVSSACFSSQGAVSFCKP